MWFHTPSYGSVRSHADHVHRAQRTMLASTSKGGINTVGCDHMRAYGALLLRWIVMIFCAEREGKKVAVRPGLFNAILVLS